jgi:hypothetical protein
MVLPGAIYGVLMYVTGIAFVFVARRLLSRYGSTSPTVPSLIQPRSVDRA